MDIRLERDLSKEEKLKFLWLELDMIGKKLELIYEYLLWIMTKSGSVASVGIDIKYQLCYKNIFINYQLFTYLNVFVIA